MKLQSLAIIFIIIIMPISIVLSEYVNNKIETEQTELLYNTRLLNATYDAIKAYQLNTVNNAFGDVTNEKVKDVESAAKTFYNSLSSNFNYTGYKSEVMKEYVPAVVFTMYDGYYTYSPFTNTLTEVPESTDSTIGYDSSYSQDGKTQEGLKPYVYYSCRYNIDSNNDFSIIYTLDNYITIQGKVNGQFVYDNGYLYSIAQNASEANNGKGIYKSGNNYIYKGVEFKSDDTEELKEFVGDTEYSYVKINGKKYYLDTEHYTNPYVGTIDLGNGIGISGKSGIFYIDSDGKRNYNQVHQYKGTGDADDKDFLRYCRAIKKNKSAYEYYKDAYEFSSAVFNGRNKTDKAGNTWNGGNILKNLKTENATIYNASNGTNMTSLSEYGNFNIFQTDGNTNIESDDSNFNKHRKAIIRYVVETNLSTSIASFSSNGATNFIMPKISETDWETIENDVCAISFLQGMSIGAKKYNGYSVVANTLTKEYIDENDIYILKNDNTYCKVNDTTIGDTNIIQKGDGTGKLPYYAGVWKLDFEQRQILITDEHEIDTTTYYNPQKSLGSYTSIMGSSGIEELGKKDMYKYIEGKSNTIKKIYLTALGRERWGSYNVNNINYELYNSSNEGEYFLKDYN